MDIEQAIRDNLEPTVHMSLATSANNKPWVCEVHFVFDEDLNLYFHSSPSRRHSQEIINNPYVAGNIVRQFAQGDKIAGVYFEGAARQLGPGEEQLKAFECYKARLGMSDNALEDTKQADKGQFYKIVVENFYFFGWLGDLPPKKYQLAWNGGSKRI